jgi:2-polyprenyl-3-methyl-5-hydroxy-6-metoxy-1,4-benzoquinol methylase
MIVDLKPITERLSALLRRRPTVVADIPSSTSTTDTMGPPVVTWPAATVERSMTCPNCGSESPKRLLLTVDFATLPGCRRSTEVLVCPDCTCPFYVSQVPPDYAEEAMLERGRVSFYLQQGAGLSLITRPLACIKAPPGSTYVEVGCGFGFGLDYANHAKRWNGKGIDPGGIAALGQNLLGVSIEQRYLADLEPELAGSCDVVMASETIEHVPSPANFVRVLRSMLRPGGTLVLTTPDGADLRPETAPDLLVGLLSPGLHLIFQNAHSLHALLTDAGFTHVDVSKDGHSLVAFASDKEPDLETDHVVLRAEYRDYLEARAEDFPPDHDLFLGFAGRALLESVNDAAFDQARRAGKLVARACKSRFGLSPAALGERALADRARAARPMPLEELIRRMPLNLACLLYADAMLRLGLRKPRPGLAGTFLQSEAAAALLRGSLADLAMADGLSEEIGWTSHTEALLCAAAAGESGVVAGLMALEPAPDAELGEARRLVILQRALIELVNARHYAIARELCKAAGFEGSAWADPTASHPRTVAERDALFGLAVLDSQSEEPAIIERAQERFHRVRLLLGSADSPGVPAGLFEAALNGELTSLDRLGRHTAAERLRTAATTRSSG